MGKYRAYESYKDSGVEWLGEIPEHWEIIPLKFLVSTRKGVAFKSVDFTNEGSRVVRASDIKNYTILESDLFLDHSFKTEYPKAILKKNEIVISTVGSMPDVKKSAVGQIGIVPANLDQSLLNQNTVIFTANNYLKLFNKFLFYCLISTRYRDHLDIHAHGTANQASLNIVDMLDYLSFIPTLEEQRTIARFLDYKTKQIDALTAKKEALLKKLDEKRTALISHAVTKGLDATVAMKDSGIEWLGDIPEHWEVIRLRFLLQEQFSNGLFKKKEYWGNGYPIINVFDVYTEDNLVNISSLDRVDCNEEELNKYSAEHGDFFFVRSSLKLEGIGKSATLLNPKEKIVFECHLVKGRPDQTKIDPEMLILYLNCNLSRAMLVSRANQVTMTTIDQSKFKDIFIPLSDLQEQKEIAEYLDRKTVEIDNLKTKIQQAIDLLKEYRTALITNAVTGKIDVRQAKVPLAKGDFLKDTASHIGGSNLSKP